MIPTAVSLGNIKDYMVENLKIMPPTNNKTILKTTELQIISFFFQFLSIVDCHNILSWIKNMIHTSKCFVKVKCCVSSNVLSKCFVNMFKV